MPDTPSSLTLSEQEEDLRRKFEASVEADLKNFYASVLEHSYKYSGAGSYFAQFHKALAKLDRFGNRIVTQNHEYSGLVFFTRPTLNLTAANLRQNRIMQMLETEDPLSIQFMIRMLLDSDLSQSPYFSEMVGRSPLIDGTSPFITPFTNYIETLSGGPNLNMESYTTEGGLFSESQAMPIGTDRNAKPIDLSISFAEIQGGINSAILLYWLLYMDLIQRGECIQYRADTEQRRMGWTCSIYRFMLDPTRQYITRWCKFTGCYPISLPTASILDYNASENFVEAAKKLNVTFKCNHTGYPQDPIILKEFNMLVSSFCPGILSKSYKKLTTNPEHNYLGLPYIIPTPDGPRLDFYAPSYADEDTLTQDLVDTSASIAQRRAALEQQISSLHQSSQTQPTPTRSDNPDIFYA